MSVAIIIPSKNSINKPTASAKGTVFDCIPQLSGFSADNICLHFVVEFFLNYTKLAKLIFLYY